jgi:hypothetical protein
MHGTPGNSLQSIILESLQLNFCKLKGLTVKYLAHPSVSTGISNKQWGANWCHLSAAFYINNTVHEYQITLGKYFEESETILLNHCKEMLLVISKIKHLFSVKIKG